eukprot:CAMPEP_0115381674 /NCGR_PEP_ID=MMETSP0271-20121206/5696_1 /TAXON_ID=71861 /ORGANISM="Scrippsiella trochoidea, Strain CCMP3099" /LENGTH=231 /DNA_ID=CAMNT_0002804969 /DNA_START=446 /DNA_END=1142 /DNA_ORIENTATION=-
MQQRFASQADAEQAGCQSLRAALPICWLPPQQLLRKPVHLLRGLSQGLCIQVIRDHAEATAEHGDPGLHCWHIDLPLQVKEKRLLHDMQIVQRHGRGIMTERLNHMAHHLGEPNPISKPVVSRVHIGFAYHAQHSNACCGHLAKEAAIGDAWRASCKPSSRTTTAWNHMDCGICSPSTTCEMQSAASLRTEGDSCLSPVVAGSNMLSSIEAWATRSSVAQWANSNLSSKSA